MSDFSKLAEYVDGTRYDRQLADEIEASLPRIKAEIEAQGHSDVTLLGKTFRITRGAAPVAEEGK